MKAQKGCPLLWDLRFPEREGGGGMADCIPYEGEDWPRDGRGCPVLWEGGEESGQVGMRRGRHKAHPVVTLLAEG